LFLTPDVSETIKDTIHSINIKRSIVQKPLKPPEIISNPIYACNFYISAIEIKNSPNKINVSCCFQVGNKKTI